MSRFLLWKKTEWLLEAESEIVDKKTYVFFTFATRGDG